MKPIKRVGQNTPHQKRNDVLRIFTPRSTPGYSYRGGAFRAGRTHTRRLALSVTCSSVVSDWVVWGLTGLIYDEGLMGLRMLRRLLRLVGCCTGPPCAACVRGKCYGRHGALCLGDSEVSVLGFELAAHLGQLVRELVARYCRVRSHVFNAHRPSSAQGLYFAPRAAYFAWWLVLNARSCAPVG